MNGNNPLDRSRRIRQLRYRHRKAHGVSHRCNMCYPGKTSDEDSASFVPGEASTLPTALNFPEAMRRHAEWQYVLIDQEGLQRPG